MEYFQRKYYSYEDEPSDPNSFCIILKMPSARSSYDGCIHETLQSERWRCFLPVPLKPDTAYSMALQMQENLSQTESDRPRLGYGKKSADEIPLPLLSLPCSD